VLAALLDGPGGILVILQPGHAGLCEGLVWKGGESGLLVNVHAGRYSGVSGEGRALRRGGGGGRGSSAGKDLLVPRQSLRSICAPQAALINLHRLHRYGGAGEVRGGREAGWGCRRNAHVMVNNLSARRLPSCRPGPPCCQPVRPPNPRPYHSKAWPGSCS